MKYLRTYLDGSGATAQSTVEVEMASVAPYQDAPPVGISAPIATKQAIFFDQSRNIFPFIPFSSSSSLIALGPPSSSSITSSINIHYINSYYCGRARERIAQFKIESKKMKKKWQNGHTQKTHHSPHNTKIDSIFLLGLLTRLQS